MLGLFVNGERERERERERESEANKPKMVNKMIKRLLLHMSGELKSWFVDFNCLRYAIGLTMNTEL